MKGSTRCLRVLTAPKPNLCWISRLSCSENATTGAGNSRPKRHAAPKPSQDSASETDSGSRRKRRLSADRDSGDELPCAEEPDEPGELLEAFGGREGRSGPAAAALEP